MRVVDVTKVEADADGCDKAKDPTTSKGPKDAHNDDPLTDEPNCVVHVLPPSFFVSDVPIVGEIVKSL